MGTIEEQNLASSLADFIALAYVNSRPHVFDNYLFYSLHTNRFPLCATDYAQAYAGFLGEFIAMLVFTAGIFHKFKRINDEDMVVGIYLYHRRVSHCPSYNEALHNLFADSGFSAFLSLCTGIK